MSRRIRASTQSTSPIDRLNRHGSSSGTPRNFRGPLVYATLGVALFTLYFLGGARSIIDSKGYTNVHSQAEVAAHSQVSSTPQDSGEGVTVELANTIDQTETPQPVLNGDNIAVPYGTVATLDTAHKGNEVASETGLKLIFIASFSASAIEQGYNELKSYNGRTMCVALLPEAPFEQIDLSIVQRGSELFGGEESDDVTNKNLEAYSNILRRQVLSIVHKTTGARRLSKSAKDKFPEHLSTVILFFRTGWSMIPFIPHLFSNAHIIWLTQDVIRWSLRGDYYPSLEPIVNITSSESIIDQLCLARLRQDKMPFAKSRDANSIPCSIDEEPVMRRATAWGELHTTTVAALEGVGVPVRMVSFYNEFPDGKLVHVLQEWGVTNLASTISRSGTRLRGSKNNKSLFVSFDIPRSHPRLWTDILSLQHEHTLHVLGYNPDKTSNDHIAQLEVIEPSAIDAGYCDQNGCLPKLLIVGAQKASTSEIHAWLLEHPLYAPLTGGSEVHFFDCVARGFGQQREVCQKVRNIENRLVFEPRNSRAFHGRRVFGWDDMQLGGQPLSDIWPFYSRLGKARTSLGKPSSTIYFEKSPAYMDLANPFDVMRLLPSAKLIISLRDPTERFYSGYYQYCKTIPKQDCNLGHFVSLVEAMLEHDTSKLPDYFQRAFDLGRYSLYINKWREAFPDDQIMIVFASHFRKYPKAVMYAIEAFTGERGVAKQHFNYKPSLTSDGSWVLNASKLTGKVVHSKDGFNVSPIAKRIRAMYLSWNKKLLHLLQQSDMIIPGYAMLGDPVPPHIEVDFSLPSWIYK